MAFNKTFLLSIRDHGVTVGKCSSEYTHAITKNKKAHWTSVGWHCGNCDRLYTNAER